MKRIVLLFLVLSLITLYLKGQSSDPQRLLDESKKLGLISYLTTVKALAELQMTILASDPSYVKDAEIGNTKRFRSDYNLLKLSVDRLLNQLSADLITKNKIKAYKKTNLFLKNTISELPKNQKNYGVLIGKIDNQINEFIRLTYSSDKSIPSISDITGVVELAHKMVTDARDFREKKVQSLILIFENVRLEKIIDLTIEKTDETE